MPHLIANHIFIPEIARLLAEGKEVMFTPTGDSMRPFIEGGKDTVVLVKKEVIRVGDICLARMPMLPGADVPKYVLHRVIEVRENEIVLQGDGNLRGMERCAKEDVYGTVIGIRTPWGKKKWLTNGRIWRTLCRPRWFWLKVYRHSILKYAYS